MAKFESKIKMNAFDKRNTKVENLKYEKVKSRTIAGTIFLSKNIGERLDYHLILGYFLGADGKTKKHFLDFGRNKNLRKHFEQVEMLSAKKDKSMAESYKEASAGEVYIKEVKGKKIIHFEPKAESKVPKGEWPKLLKKLKPFLKGMQSVVVFAGEVVSEEEDNKELENTSTVPKSSAEIIKALIIDITGVLKEALPKVVVPNIKAKKVSQEDADVTNGLLDNLSKLEVAYKEASTEVQQKIEKHYLAIMGQVPKLEKIKDAIDNLIGIESMEELLKASDNDAQEVKQLKELLDYVIKETASIWKNVDEAEEEISNSSSEVIKGGEDLLNALFN